MGQEKRIQLNYDWTGSVPKSTTCIEIAHSVHMCIVHSYLPEYLQNVEWWCRAAAFFFFLFSFFFFLFQSLCLPICKRIIRSDKGSNQLAYKKSTRQIFALLSHKVTNLFEAFCVRHKTSRFDFVGRTNVLDILPTIAVETFSVSLMPRFFCDYCDAYLTHDSAPGRQQHIRGAS